LRIDCKATVLLGDVSRGGRTRGDDRACDHDLGCQEQYIPCGIVDEETGQLRILFGSSSTTPIQLLYSPPSHSKDNPIERCWGIWELHWHGTKLLDVETMRAWAKSMTWKGMEPVVALSRQVYQKGIALGKHAMCEIEKRLERHPQLPKGDILIRPASTG
jgi:hypothetical protein